MIILLKTNVIKGMQKIHIEILEEEGGLLSVQAQSMLATKWV